MNDPHATPKRARPPRQARTGRTQTGARKAASKSERSRARGFALQGIYQSLVGGNVLADIDPFTRDLAGFHKADSVHFDTLLHGCVEQALALEALIGPLLDRPWAEIAPVERAIMRMGTYELQFCLDVPWKVVLDEYIELAKEFGGTDGHKYVNAVLHALAQDLRKPEMGSAPAQRPAPSQG